MALYLLSPLLDALPSKTYTVSTHTPGGRRNAHHEPGYLEPLARLPQVQRGLRPLLHVLPRQPAGPLWRRHLQGQNQLQSALEKGSTGQL